MSFSWPKVILPFVLVLTALAPARADLVLSNYTLAKPLTIMSIGDSITDDCEINGAWRQYLQVLLENSGFPFTFVGRQQSATSPNFTKVRHEGYCGAVIAPPGVLTTPVHGYDGTNVYLQKIALDALTATKPDLVLVLIGANDIGRGRDPYRVATNDMPNLLGIIFSKVPNAHVILAKTTSLQDANLLNYGAFATNVPIYNACLEQMVNQRRAAGQNVFLADMFSAVDYATMFITDHVHPNALGLIAIGREWLARIQAITIRTNQATSVVLRAGADWKYSDTGQDLGTNWAQPNYDDHDWNTGPARLGFGDPAVATTVSFGPDLTNKYSTTYFRRFFFISAELNVTNLNLRLARGDGAAVWLNGREIFRTNLPGGPIAWTNLALRRMTAFTPQIFYPTNLLLPDLQRGTNLLAVELHPSSVTNSSMGFDLEVIAMGTNLPPPALTISLTSSNLLLSWPLTNAIGYTLYSTTNLSPPAAWTSWTNALQTNGSQIVAPLSPDRAGNFFRLQR